MHSKVKVRQAARTKSFRSALASALTHLLCNSSAWCCQPLEGPVPEQHTRQLFLNTSEDLGSGICWFNSSISVISSG